MSQKTRKRQGIDNKHRITEQLSLAECVAVVMLFGGFVAIAIIMFTVMVGAV